MPLIRSASGGRRMAQAITITASLSLSLCLASCSDGKSASQAEPSQEATAPSSPFTLPTLSTPAPPPVRAQNTPGAVPTLNQAPNPDSGWTPPALKFYNDDYSVWYQDDSITQQDSVTDRGNLEGYRTYDGYCLGYVIRDISSVYHQQRFDDDRYSRNRAGQAEPIVHDFNSDKPEKLGLVKDDGGIMDGYSAHWTGITDSKQWSQRDLTGYRFSRVVGDAGLRFDVWIGCESGHEISADQWHTILGGIRIEGMDSPAL
ncbi:MULTISPECIES: hypothetical protein [Actinomyces]|uniref:Uncharacterized protein n=1 Tax=Actinomyces marmotae TaxID=2737173 RepID=A0A6M8B5Q2_9ACTO|nr:MULTISPECIES: hypothetical protein [Actinomyces]QKD79977.1 hypothetical protein HPC72_06815 [Actinomyces marmotae]